MANSSYKKATTSSLPWTVAAEYGQEDVLELLLQNGAHLNSTLKMYEQVYDRAITHGYATIARILKEHEQDLSASS